MSDSVLAKQKNAPILLVNRTVESSGVAFDYVKNHLHKDGAVYILGGTGIIPKKFEMAFNDLGYKNIIRLGGWREGESS